MSKTYNTKNDFQKKLHVYEFKNGYVRNGQVIKPGEVIEYDPSFTTFSDNNDSFNAHVTTVRHPNKKKKTNSLGREFITTGISGTRYWRNRFGEENDKSSRMRLIKRELTQKRRNKLKNLTKEIISEALNED